MTKPPVSEGVGSPGAALHRRLDFPFRSGDPRCGIPLSNGSFGAVLWGRGSALRITMGRRDYRASGSLIEDGDARLPIGTVELELPGEWALDTGGLHLLSGEVEAELDGPRAQAKLRAVLLPDLPVLAARVTGLQGHVRVTSRPPDAPEAVERLRAAGLARPQLFDLGEFGGWVQPMAPDRSLCAAWLRHASPTGFLLYAAAVYGADAAAARREALRTLEAARAEGYTPVSLRCFSWWRKWWEDELEAEVQAPPLLHGLRRLTDSRGRLSLAAGEAGVVRVSLDGRELAAEPLRPDWLDGQALSAHPRDPRRWGPALR
jgi:hypothetical protein